MQIGSKISQERKRKGFTQKQLGKLCDIAEPTIRKYESDRLNPKYETIAKIAAALNVPISEFLTDEQLDARKMDVAHRGLIALLESVYDTVIVDWHYTVSDGEPEYDGDFTVTLTHGGNSDICLTKKEWESLFALVSG